VCGRVVQRHDGIRDAVKDWTPHAKKKHVPMWDTEKEQAILDVFYTTKQGTPQHVDTTVMAAEPTSADLAGTLQRRDSVKHERYLCSSLIPFVFDVRGRWGKEAKAWARDVARPPLAQTHRRSCTRVSMSLQVGVAEQFLRSVGAPRPSCS
jgi:hypothetical protein